MGVDVLFVLQNAWRRGAVPGEVESDHEPRAWIRGLWRSQTSKRLREMIPEDMFSLDTFEVVNASELVGNRASAVFAFDSVLMQSRLRLIQPSLVVLCGKVAQGLLPVVERYGLPYVLTPHPTWRLLSKVRTAEIRAEIEEKVRSL